MRRIVCVGLLVLAGAGCNPLGPSCLERREEGTLAGDSGSVDAGETSMHVVAYDTRGSQNDVRLSWSGQSAADGPQLRAYATRADCQTFTLPAESNTGACAVLASAGRSPTGTSTTLIVTHGRGNPERLGSPPEFKLWVVSDRLTSYSFTIRWFFGPDC
jgi:hypothetical protein